MFRYAIVKSLTLLSNKKVLSGRSFRKVTTRSRYLISRALLWEVLSVQGFTQMHSRVLWFIDDAL
jgi:hypothetical protein